MLRYPLPIHYDRAEKRGAVSLCCREIECFRPTQFAAVGYPFHISSISELWKYTECMHEGIGLTEPMFKYLLSYFVMNGFTKQEFDEIKLIKAAIDDLARFLGRPCEYPMNSMFLAINQARHISALAPTGSTIVELGGGAGYLGALLALRGYRYVATDVSQALFLMQSHLLSRVAPGGCLEFLDEKYEPSDLRTLQPGQVAMVPWWRWVQRSVPAALSIDLATSNHNLLEMHPFSRLYHLTVIRENLSPNAVGMVFEGWGDPSRHATWTAVRDLSDKGFVLAHNDRRITCFVTDGSHPAGSVLRYPLPLPATAQAGSPPPTPDIANASTQRPSMLERAGKKFLQKAFPSLLSGLQAAIATRLNKVDPSTPFSLNEFHYANPEFREPSNPLSKAVMTMREKERGALAFGIDDYRKLMGGGDLVSADDRFLNHIFRGTNFSQERSQPS